MSCVSNIHFLLLILKSLLIKRRWNIQQTKVCSRHTMSRLYVTEFCESIVCGWCYFEFLKDISIESQDNILGFWVHLCVLSVIFSSQGVLMQLNWVNLGKCWGLHANVLMSRSTSQMQQFDCDSVRRWMWYMLF